MAEPGALELQPGDRLEVAGHEAQPDVGASGEAVEQVAHPGRDGRRQVGRAAARERLGRGQAQVAQPLVDAPGRDAELEEDVTGDLQVGAAARVDADAPRVADAVDLADPVVQRLEVLA